MSIYEFSIRKPVSLTMIYIAVIFLGIRSFLMLPQELFPPLTFPQLTIVTTYGNASPEEIETLVTKILEEAIATVKNLKAIHSYSREGTSIIIAEFNWGTDMDFASLNLREKIDLVKERLPREAEEPLVLKFNPFAKPIMVFSMSSKGDPNDPNTITMPELLKIAKLRIKDKLEKVPGVASVSISGGQEREIKVDLNLKQLVANKINILDVPTALRDSNLNYPAGSIKEDFFEYLVRTMGEFKSINDIENCTVSIENIKRGKYDRARKKEQEKSGSQEEDKEIQDLSSQYIALKDVAQIEDDFKEKTSYSRYQGKENISLTIQKQATANIIKTVENVKKELNRLQNQTNAIPRNVDVSLIYDESVFIKSSIMGVINSAWEGGMLAFIVLYLFLHSFITAAIVSITIPISILPTLTALEFSGFSLNMMSLGGLALAIGMMVDGSIVVMENIERHKTLNPNWEEAAIKASREVFLAIFASQLTTVVVFLPLGYVVGIAGQLFKPISFTVVFSLMISILVAITIIPRLSITKLGASSNANASGLFMKGFEKIYRGALTLFLESYSLAGSFFVIVLFCLSLFLLSRMETEIMPKVDQGQFNIKMTLPTGTILERTNETAQLIEKEIQKESEIDSILVAVGSDKSSGQLSVESLGQHQAQIVVKLKKEERKKTTHQIVMEIQDAVMEIKRKMEEEINKKEKEIETISNEEVKKKEIKSLIKKRNDLYALKMAEIIYTLEDNPFAGAFTSSAAIGIQITGRDLNKLQNLVNRVQKLLQNVPGVINIRNDIPSKSPEIRIIPNRRRAALAGINASDIAQTALISIRGLPGTKLKEEGNETDVLVRLRKKDRESSDSLKNIMLFSEDKTVPLKDVAEIKEGQGPSEIHRLDQIRIFNVYADIRNRSEVEVIREIQDILKNEKLEENYFMGFGREQEEKKASQKSLLLAFAISVALVYMIMAAEFESLMQPFIIMMTVPLSVIGMGFALFLTKITVNAMSILGLIILAGVVVNQGIVMIEFINQLREEGHPLKEAVIDACCIRLRPIMISTITTILGLFPLALKWEEGSEFQQPMAIAVIGGLTCSFILTLFIIPAIYLAVESFFLKRKKKRIMI
ncbi:MAG: efflux RND transporter permease subunit [Candidatus Aureabacteria bacterium]|nr:efflux RND transporter permease subunit [Candidatus Auribacterota bacterium]